MTSSIAPHLILRMVISLNVDIIDSTRLVGHRTQGILLVLPLQCLDYRHMSPHPYFYMVVTYLHTNIHLSLHVFTSSILPTNFFDDYVSPKHSHIFLHSLLRLRYRTLPASKKITSATFQWLPLSNNHSLVFCHPHLMLNSEKSCAWCVACSDSPLDLLLA